ncbi:hypothetical protein K438DRAFT_1836309 [Mycena galopus ATCC 62051]|nr:hypothetical protein K438DRAFT_1836309 [Mycena galopus ATCC 62051]
MGRLGCRVGLRSVIRVSVLLFLSCYPHTCTAPLRFALCCDSDHPILDHARCSSSVLRSILPHLVLLVTTLPPPLARILVCPPPSPRALPRASSRRAPTFPFLPHRPPMAITFLPLPHPFSFSPPFLLLSRFLLPPLPPLGSPARPPPVPPLTHSQ